MKYIPILLSSLKDCFKELPFDIYLMIAPEKYVKAFDKTTGLDFARLASYEAKNVRFFYVSENEQAALDRFFANAPTMVLANPQAPPPIRRKAFWAAMEQSLCDSFLLASTTQVSVKKAYSALHTGLNKDTDFMKMFAVLLQTGPSDNGFFKHAISTAAFAYLLCVLNDLKSPRSLKIILFAALFHDLGKLKLPEPRRITANNKTIEEIVEYRKHPTSTLEIMKDPLPFADEEIRNCIAQHRERVDGRGYPNGLKSINIYNLSRILAVADAFSELTLGLVDGYRYSREQAIAVLKSEEGRLDPKILAQLVQIVLNRTELKAG